MTSRKISFDGWVLDRETGDLSRDGHRQRLQELPLKVLDLLLASPGALVTRDQLIAHLWPKGVVDFDTGINTAVRKLRVALADIADAPRYIETIPRRGYRFIGVLDPEPAGAVDGGKVESIAHSVPSLIPQEPLIDGASALVPTPVPGPNLPVDPPIVPLPQSAPQPRGWRWGGIAATFAVCLGLAYWLSHRAGTPTAATSPPTTVSLPDRSVAVLPFESLSAEPNNAFLALGIAETVLNRLGSLRDLTVIARTSSFVFKNRNEDARQIGLALNARYLVEGSVQRAGERLRVQAQLVDASSGKQMWSLAFDRPLADIFALQDEISSRVAEQLSVSLTPQKRASNEVNNAHLDAYLSYLQGRALNNTGKIADARTAIQFFARAVQIDPQFAAAYAQESRALTRLNGLQERENPEDLKRAITLNDRALALDPELGEAWVQRASLLLAVSNDKDAVEAEKAFHKGLALAPNYGEGFEEYANFLWAENRLDDALIAIERARQVDPLTPRNHYMKALLFDLMGKETPEIESLYLHALQLDPNYHSALVRLGWLYNFRGDYARALMLQERAVRAEPEALWIREDTAATYLMIGDVAAADDVMSGVKGRNGRMDICLLMIKKDDVAAVRKAYDLFGAGHPDTPTMVQLCAATEILRNALTSRQYDRALRTLQSQYSIHAGTLFEAAHTGFVWGLPLAQLLLAKGDARRANQLAESILAANERDPVESGFKPMVLLARAGALAVLGDHDRALDALEKSAREQAHTHWWIIDRGATFDGLKQDRRYQALAAEMADKARKQAALVAKMRVAHELPQRPEKLPSAN